jgi:ABC-type multidrug transport system ATPase subunit
VVAHPALAKQLIGVVSQQNTLDRQLTVWENLYFHGRLFGIPARESRKIADELLEQFQLSKWAKASVYALSGGMAQRLMVARAIFHRPAVLFLDEPTAGLDPQSRLALWEILGELNRDGQTILLTTHYMEEADQLCDRVAIMDHGKILALDTPAGAQAVVGADTIVTVKAAATRGAGASCSQQEIEGVTRTARDRRRRRAARQGRRAARAAGRHRRRERRLRARRPVGRRAEPRDRVHQPHRQGAARLMTTTTARSAPPGRRIAHRAIAPSRRARDGRQPHRAGALILRDLVVLRKHFVEFVIRTLIQPFLLVFVFLYVFPTIGQGVGGGGGGAESASPPCSSPAWSGSRSCSRASRRSPAAVAGVRLHARDRGPRAGAVPDLAGRRWRRSSPAPRRGCSPR